MATRDPRSSTTDLLGSYRKHLQTTCGVTPGTSGLFIWHITKFLAARFSSRRIDSGALKPADIIRYVSSLAAHYTPNTRKSAVSALRSFLRWLQLTGQCTSSLVDAVPTVSSHRQSELPTHLSEPELARLLRAFDRRTARGQRGYAAALCMVRLGLRVGEVARLSLDDIDWRAGTLRVPRAKGRRAHTLPVTRDVGAAIVVYLRKGRPATSGRHLFGRHAPPLDQPAGREALRSDIYRAFQRAGLGTASKGTRVLRHTAATRLIQRGVSLKSIADVLGHRSIDTTAIYAKVDLPALREIALPWPEVIP